MLAGVDYDGIAGVLRVLKAGEEPDTFAIEVVTYHAAIESELERVIEASIKRPDGLFSASPKLTFGHKANVLRAVWLGNPEHADVLNEVLHRFQMLRNAVAHPSSAEIKGCLAGLRQAYRKIDDRAEDEVPVVEIAQGICLYMEDGSNPSQWNDIFQRLDKLVNVTAVQALGGHADDDRA